jgi:hypothetical protein
VVRNRFLLVPWLLPRPALGDEFCNMWVHASAVRSACWGLVECDLTPQRCRLDIAREGARHQFAPLSRAGRVHRIAQFYLMQKCSDQLRESRRRQGGSALVTKDIQEAK